MTSDLTLVLRRNAVKALSRGDLVEAHTIIQRLEAEDPASLESRGLRLEYLLKADRLSEASALAEQLGNLHPASARVRLLCGQLALKRKEPAVAIDHFEESRRLAPHPATERWLGKALSFAGRLDEAEAVLRRVVEADFGAHQDLAFVEERRGRIDAAIEHWERYLARWPDSAWAKQSIERLKARRMEPTELVSEIETLRAVGEAVPKNLFPEYVEGLLKTGDGARAREVVAEHLPSLEARTALRTAWIAYHLQALDLAFDLFVRALPDFSNDAKLLSALESAAKRIHRVPDLIRVYEARVTSDRRFYGRLRTLGRFLNDA